MKPASTFSVRPLQPTKETSAANRSLRLLAFGGVVLDVHFARLFFLVIRHGVKPGLEEVIRLFSEPQALVLDWASGGMAFSKFRHW